MLHNEKVYPDPFSFKPDRFLKGGKINKAVPDPADAAFGFGRRYVMSQSFSFSQSMTPCLKDMSRSIYGLSCRMDCSSRSYCSFWHHWSCWREWKYYQGWSRICQCISKVRDFPDNQKTSHELDSWFTVFLSHSHVQWCPDQRSMHKLFKRRQVRIMYMIYRVIWARRVSLLEVRFLCNEHL